MAEAPQKPEWLIEDPEAATIRREDARMVEVQDFPDEDRRPRRTPALIGFSHQFNVVLGSRAMIVNTGTPVGIVNGEWAATRFPEQTQGFSAHFTEPGAKLVVCREATLETYYKQFEPGKNYAVLDIDDVGRVRFKKDVYGPHIALSESQILMTREH